jgi:TM2 domain-containing membrane protein YozV
MKSRTITAMVLAFLVPGLGHLYLGRRARAITFFVIVMLLFAIGLAVDGRLYTFEQGNLLATLATIGSMGLGAPYFIARMSGTHGDITSITFEYGTAFTLTAGLMNLLLVLDSFDIAEGRKE